jgi:hypothetical protein
MYRIAVPALVVVIAAALPAQGDAPKNPKELGAVRWHRDLGAGLEQAKALARPVFLQFQEVPG